MGADSLNRGQNQQSGVELVVQLHYAGELLAAGVRA
jgi:hypothetical protein